MELLNLSDIFSLSSWTIIELSSHVALYYHIKLSTCTRKFMNLSRGRALNFVGKSISVFKLTKWNQLICCAEQKKCDVLDTEIFLIETFLHFLFTLLTITLNLRLISEYTSEILQITSISCKYWLHILCCLLVWWYPRDNKN